MYDVLSILYKEIVSKKLFRKINLFFFFFPKRLGILFFQVEREQMENAFFETGA